MKLKLFSVFFLSTILLASSAFAKCQAKINISSKEDTTLLENLHQISNICKTSLIVEDDYAMQRLQRPYRTLYLKDVAYEDAIAFLLEKEFFYALEGDSLRIWFFDTKTFKLNYIASSRESRSSTKLSLDIAASGDGEKGGTGGNSQVEVSSNTAFDFWGDMTRDISQILLQHRQTNIKLLSETGVNQHLVVNQKSGSIYVQGSKKQLAEVEKYITEVSKTISKQVLVDINILQVKLSEIHKTGIDWGQISDLQNIGANFSFGTNAGSTLAEDVLGATTESSLRIVKDINIDSLLAFIQSHGKTNTISNPRILAINNQTAIISIGQQIYYKIQKTTTITQNATTQTQDEEVDSIFAGIVVDITPAISEDNEIILKINKSITKLVSDTKSAQSSTTLTSRTIPPDLEKQEISTVIKAKNGEKIVLGGLISNNTQNGTSGIVGLKNLPFFGKLFGTKSVNEIKDELVIIITPKVIDL